MTNAILVTVSLLILSLLAGGFYLLSPSNQNDSFEEITVRVELIKRKLNIIREKVKGYSCSTVVT